MDAFEVRLLDTDNLHHESPESSITIYTRFFAAPELVQEQSRVNTLTDAHAFSVLAFQTLCIVHPLIGDMVNDGEPDLEKQALKGLLPWIDDPDDDTNRSSHGIPREIVLSPRLQNLCKDCFGVGLREPKEKRPGITKWTEALYAAADYTVHCLSCHGTYYANQQNCPWCEHPRSTFVQVRVRRWEPENGVTDAPKGLPVLALDIAKPLILTSRILRITTGSQGHTPEIELILEKRRISVRSLCNQVFWLSSWQGSQKVEVRERVRFFPVEPDKLGSWLLHFGPLDCPHRVAIFQLFPGESL